MEIETPEEFLMKYGICSDTTIGIEGDKKLTELLEEYADQALRIHNVVERSEQLKAFLSYIQESQADGETIVDNDKFVEGYLKSL